ncbi:MAG: ACP phosphodiesterase [Xenococcaceae cyanobacterium]
MNYLAHLLLAEESAESRIGNLLGDFVKGPLKGCETLYSESIIKGIRTHRQVDYFTDKHRVYIRSKSRIDNSQRRFAGIIIDICYDHFLARHWEVFSDEKLEDFVANIYGILEKNKEILPERLRNVLPRMVSEDWLGSYKQPEGVGLAFARLARRLNRANNLAAAQHELTNNYTEIESDFLSFFPELVSYVEKNRQDF